MRRALLAIAVVTAAACGGEGGVYRPPDDVALDSGVGSAPDTNEQVTADVATADAAPPADVTTDAGADDSPDMSPAPQPRQLTPCMNADCWETSLGGTPCSVTTHDEDYSSGNYNVHRYRSLVWEETPTTITVTKGAGTWEPAIVVADLDGEVLYDGDVGAQRPGLSVTANSPAEVVVTSDALLGVDIFTTSVDVIESDFTSRISTDATYTISLTSDCGGERIDCTVNDNPVREPACGWLHYTARRVVPRLRGTRAERIDAAGVVAWWSLKEGVMFLDNPIVYSNCNFPDGDAYIGPLESCVPDRAWQVGLSAVQVPYQTDAEVEGSAEALYPDLTLDEVLRLTATEARLDADSIDAVVGSSGALRRSWLLRNSAVGFEIEEPVVRRECIDDTRSWCYGTGWDTTRLYAPDRSAALRAIEDVKAILDQLAP